MMTDDELADLFTKHIHNGDYIEAGWVAKMLCAKPEHVSDAITMSMRLAFFVGAKYLFELLIDPKNEIEKTEREFRALADAIYDELKRFDVATTENVRKIKGKLRAQKTH